ncbi:MAG: hypothetical protein AAFY63_21410, partial [Cyanobacteria bacterium J06643_13]
MHVSELLSNLDRQGVQLWSDRDKLRINAPKGTLTPRLQADLIARKREIIAFLREDNDSACPTSTGLILQTIGRLIGGFDSSSSLNFKSPIIDPQVMAKHLKVTLRPLPPGFNNKTILQFRAELISKLQNYGVQIIPWSQATRDFTYEIAIPLTKWKKTIKTRVVKPDINAVIDVNRPINWLKGFIAEKIYQIYSRFFFGESKKTIATITKLIAWAEDHTIQRLEDPTATQVIMLT